MIIRLESEYASRLSILTEVLLMIEDIRDGIIAVQPGKKINKREIELVRQLSEALKDVFSELKAFEGDSVRRDTKILNFSIGTIDSNSKNS